MIERMLIILVLLWSISGCALLENLWVQEEPSENLKQTPAETDEFCWVAQNKDSPGIDNNCALRYWLSYWLEVDNMSWPDRRTEIKALGVGIKDTLKKILLSQSTGTPYQARLRAQSWVNELMPKLTPKMQSLLAVVVYKPSQEMLEFESALTVLSRINTNQSKQLDRQSERLAEQQKQIELLLKIEASMMEKKEEISL